MSELPGMWDESDLSGGEADSFNDLQIVRKLKSELAAIRAENEALKYELTEKQKYILQLEKRVAELEGDFKLIEAALLARKAINDGFVDIPADIDSAEKFIAWIKEEPANEG